MTVGHEGRILSLARSAPGNGSLSTLRNSREASGPALVFIQAEIGAVVRGVKAGEIRLPDLTDKLT
jgi:hypothetical protein